MPPRWRIYYDDGRTFASNDGEPGDAPAFGVQVIVQYDTGRQVLSRWDYYWWNGQWFGGDIFGMFDFIAHVGGKIKFGRVIPRAAFDEIHKRAVNDSEFPLTGVGRDEMAIK